MDGGMTETQIGIDVSTALKALPFVVDPVIDPIHQSYDIETDETTVRITATFKLARMARTTG
jgi:hypothetical protein